MLAYHRRVHDALTVHHTSKTTRPGRVDQAVHQSAAIELGNVTLAQLAVVGHHDGHRRIKLTKAAQHPVLTLLLVVTGNAHGFEQLHGNLDLTLTVQPLITPGIAGFL